MPTICRLIQLTPETAARLVADPETLPDVVQAKGYKSDVYRYWHAIEYLLAKHQPGSVAATWLTLGTPVSDATAEIPSSRVVTPAEVGSLAAELSEIPPDDLFPHYDAAALDAAGVSPATWVAWEEDFDPLGQVLEHYAFLQEFTGRTATDGKAMLLRFEFLEEGSV